MSLNEICEALFVFISFFEGEFVFISNVDNFDVNRLYLIMGYMQIRGVVPMMGRICKLSTRNSFSQFPIYI